MDRLVGKLAGSSWETYMRRLEEPPIQRPSATETANGAESPSSGRRSYALDRRIAALQARLADEESWQTLNDLSVASLERWRQFEQGAGLVQSLEYAARAGQRSDNPTTRYNLALVLAELGLEQSSIEAWEQFTQLAEEREIPQAPRLLGLRELEEQKKRSRDAFEEQAWFETSCSRDVPELDASPLTPATADRIRLKAECGLLLGWSTAVASEDPELATKTLAAGLDIGRRLKAVQNGDSFVADLYRFLGSNMDLEVTDAHLALARGIQAHENGDYAESLAALRKAEPVLAGARSPAFWLAQLFLARAEFRFDISRSESTVRQALDTIDESRFPHLAGRLRIQLGSVLAASGRNLEALKEFQRSRDLLSRGCGSTLATFVDALVADNYRELGSFRSAWTHRIRVSRAESVWRSSSAEHSLLSQMVQAMSEEGYPHAARIAGRETLHHAVRSTTRGKLLVYANLILAHSLLELGDHGAMAHVDKAREVVARLSDADFSWIDKSLALLEGRARYSESAAHAERLFAQAIAAFEQEGNDFGLEIAWLARAEARAARGRLDGARSDFDRVVGLLEARRDAAPGRARVTSLIRAQTAFDGLTRLAAQRGDHRGALNVAERARARYLLDLVPRSDFEIATVDRILRSTPPDTAMIFYSILEDGGLFVWTIADGDVEFHEVDQGGAEVTRSARMYRHMLETEVEGAEEAMLARKLYRLLIEPSGIRPDAYRRWVVVPDRALFRVPFGALISPHTGRRLLEDVAVVVSPSLSLLTHSSVSAEARAASRQGRDATRALVVVEPDEIFNESLGWFPRLPGVELEKEGLRSVYSDMTLVEGNDLSEASLLQLLGENQVFHFAGHSVESEGRPEGTGLLLSRSNAAASLLSFDQLPHDLDPPELIFLSSCHSMGGYRPDREGVLGLASFLFARGAGAVVGSLWSTRDDVAADVAVGFHRHYQQGSSAAEALRNAVLEQGIRTMPVHAWSNYVVMEKVF